MNDPISNPLWLLGRSISLDIRILTNPRWSISKRLDFLFRKYQLLVRHSFKPFRLYEDTVDLFGQTICYGTKYGLSDYQSMLTRLDRLLDLAGVKKAKTIVDIGANVGFYSRLVLEKYPGAQVYAIEPVPQVFECLKNNLSAYQNVKTFNCAISSITGSIKMDFDPANSLISRLKKEGNVKVPATTLDDFCTKNKIKTIDILKIDVETFEDQVLQGAQRTLKNVKYLMLEVTIEDNSNYTISKLFSLLYSKYFDFQIVAFRNYSDTAEGKISLMDTIFVNRMCK